MDEEYHIHLLSRKLILQCIFITGLLIKLNELASGVVWGLIVAALVGNMLYGLLIRHYLSQFKLNS